LEPAPVQVEPTTISILHWGRLLDGELFATSRYVQWAVLMKRTWGCDVLRCTFALPTRCKVVSAGFEPPKPLDPPLP